jgi:hypothetical protein
MDFGDEIKALAAKIPKISENICTEEATKNALIMPFLNILGYNVFDPTEVVPEFTADHGTKKGEKVDYAIIKDGKPSILIECKCIDSNLNNEQASQLFRYFSVTDAKVGVLTNGITYRFFSDLDSPNKMDDKPFLEINLLEIKEPHIGEIKRFTKGSFDPDGLASAATELKYVKEIKQILAEELTNPSEEFVKYFAKRVYSGLLKKNVREKFTPLTKKAFNQFINDIINERLKSAMAEEIPTVKPNDENGSSIEKPDDNGGIITTDDELEGYYIIRAILHEIVDPDKVSIRDNKSYCAILFEDNNRKPICRLYFNSKQKYLGIFNEDKNMEKMPIESLKEIYGFSDTLRDIAKVYINDN